MFYLALSWAAVQVTSPANVGLILVANAIPRAVLLSLGGVLVDRAGPKRLIISSDSTRVLVMLAMAAVTVAAEPGVALLTVLALVFGVVDGFFLPAVAAAPPYVAPASTMTRIQALKTFVSRASMFVGPPLAAGLVLIGGTGMAFAGIAVLCAFSVGLLAATTMRRPAESEVADASVDTGLGDDVEPPPHAVAHGGTELTLTGAETATETSPEVPRKPGRGRVRAWASELTGGFRALRSLPTVATLVALVALIELGFSGPMTAGPALLANEHGWGAGGAGILLGAFGAGASAAALLLATRGAPRRSGPLIPAGLALIAVSMILIGLGDRFGLGQPAELVAAGVFAAIAGFGSGIFGTVTHTALVTLTPITQLGRVMAVVVLAAEAVMPISLAATGWAAEMVTAEITFAGGGALVLLAALLALASGRVRAIAQPTG